MVGGLDVTERERKLRQPVFHAAGERPVRRAGGVRCRMLGLVFEMENERRGMLAVKAYRTTAEAAEPTVGGQLQRLPIPVGGCTPAIALDETRLFAQQPDASFAGILQPADERVLRERQPPGGRQVGQKATGHGSARRLGRMASKRHPHPFAAASRSSRASSVLKRSSGRSIGT